MALVQPKTLVMFDGKQFYQWLNNIEQNRDIHYSLKSLKSMEIPHRLIEEVVEIVEIYLRSDIYWKTAMKLIRRLEAKAKYPDLSEYAPSLKDSETMKRGWRNARLQRMDELEWIKRKEEKIQGFDGDCIKERFEIVKNDGETLKILNGIWRKCKKKHKKRTRRKHYSRL